MATTTIKYFKFTKVDGDSGFSVISYPSQNQVLPDLPGLNVFWSEGQWYYGTADSTAKENRLNHIYCLTEEEVYSSLSDSIEGEKNNCLARISESYTKICGLIDAKYDQESSPIGAQRYADAKDYVANGNISDLLTEETKISGQDLQSLSADIISSYEGYLAEHARLSGLKNLIATRISSYTVDPENFIESFFNWRNDKEDLGNSDENPGLFGAFAADPLDVEFDTEKNYTIKLYSPNLHARWEALK